MRRFVGDGSTIVRIGNRMFKYLKHQRLIFGNSPDLSSLGFKYDAELFIQENIDKDLFDSAYCINATVGLYLNKYKVSVISYNEETKEILIRLSDNDGMTAGIKPQKDKYERDNLFYEAHVPEDDLSEIYEIREDVSGFPFESPRIVFHKKDGVWLQYHELGALLKDDEWL